MMKRSVPARCTAFLLCFLLPSSSPAAKDKPPTVAELRAAATRVARAIAKGDVNGYKLGMVEKRKLLNSLAGRERQKRLDVLFAATVRKRLAPLGKGRELDALERQVIQHQKETRPFPEAKEAFRRYFTAVAVLTNVAMMMNDSSYMRPLQAHYEHLVRLGHRHEDMVGAYSKLVRSTEVDAGRATDLVGIGRCLARFEKLREEIPASRPILKELLTLLGDACEQSVQNDTELPIIQTITKEHQRAISQRRPDAIRDTLHLR